VVEFAIQEFCILLPFLFSLYNYQDAMNVSLIHD